MTGRAAGYCAGYDRPGYASDIPGMGYGMNRGGGRGRGWRRRNWFHATGQPRWMRFRAAPSWAPPAAEPETETLKAQAQWLRTQLDAVEERLTELDRNE